MKTSLTEKQQAVLDFIEEYQLENGSSPTIKEMRINFKVSSDNSILKHLKALTEKGYIQKNDTPRGIKLLSTIKEKLEAVASQIRIPVLGEIPAGGPVTSEENILDWKTLDISMIKDAKKSFILNVRGDSMEDAGIYEGDQVIAEQGREPRNGDIVIALIDGGSTVKRFIREANKAYLKPENKKYKDIYPTESLEIQGVVTGLLRAY